LIINASFEVPCGNLKKGRLQSVYFEPSANPAPLISQKIFFLRRTRVMSDSDLAKLYGVSTKYLNQAVKSSASRLHAIHCSARFGAVQANLATMRTFLRLRELLALHKEPRRKIESLEKIYDARLQAVFCGHPGQNARHCFSRKTPASDSTQERNPYRPKLMLLTAGLNNTKQEV